METWKVSWELKMDVYSQSSPLGVDAEEGLMNLLSPMSLQLTLGHLGTNSTLKLSHRSHQNPQTPQETGSGVCSSQPG